MEKKVALTGKVTGLMEKVVAVTGAGLIIPAVTDFTEIGTVAGNEGAANKQVENVTAVPGYSGSKLCRLSRLTRFSLFAARKALIMGREEMNEELGLYMALTHGSASLLCKFHDYFFEYGPGQSSPTAFANGVMNAPLSMVSTFLKITKGGFTLIGWENGGLELMNQAAFAVLNGEFSAVLVGASEEYSKIVEEAYAACGWYSGRVPAFLPLPQQGDNSKVKKGFSVSEGSAFLLLEHPERVRALKKKPIAFFEPLSNLPADRAHPDLIISGAGAGPHDIHELRLLKKIVFRQPGPISIIFSKPFFGECFALGSLLSSVMACDYLNNRTDYRGIPLHRDLTGKTLSETGRDNCRSILVTAAGRNGQTALGMFYPPEWSRLYLA